MSITHPAPRLPAPVTAAPVTATGRRPLPATRRDAAVRLRRYLHRLVEAHQIAGDRDRVARGAYQAGSAALRTPGLELVGAWLTRVATYGPVKRAYALSPAPAMLAAVDDLIEHGTPVQWSIHADPDGHLIVMALHTGGELRTAHAAFCRCTAAVVHTAADAERLSAWLRARMREQPPAEIDNPEEAPRDGDRRPHLR